MTLADKICTCRRKQGLSQEALAAKLNVSRQAVSKWETGDTEPESGKLAALARTFGVTVDWLLSVDDDQLEEEPYAVQPVSPAPQITKIHRAGVFSNLRLGYMGYLVCLSVLLFAEMTVDHHGIPGFSWSIDVAQVINFFDPVLLLTMLASSVLLLCGCKLLPAMAGAFRFMFSKKEYESCSTAQAARYRRGVRTAFLGFVLGGMLSAVSDVIHTIKSMSLAAEVGGALLYSLDFLVYSLVALLILLPIEQALKQR